MTFPTDVQSITPSDMTMYQCDTQDCAPGHDFGPAVRDHLLIHYIFKGKGKFCVGERTFHLQKGQGFLIFPGIITYYQADFDDPWSYSWVGFNGINAEKYLKNANLTQESPIFTYTDTEKLRSCIDNIISAKSLNKSKEIRMLGLLYLFLSELIEENGSINTIEQSNNRKEIYLRKAIEYIGMNYSRKISITDIAKYTGLDRSYMGSIFKQQLNFSPQEFLINFRINKACEFMKDENLTVGDISRSVGYEDPLLFSKTFKKLKNLSPREYMKLKPVKPPEPTKDLSKGFYSCK